MWPSNKGWVEHPEFLDARTKDKNTPKKVLMGFQKVCLFFGLNNFEGYGDSWLSMCHFFGHTCMPKLGTNATRAVLSFFLDGGLK